MKHCDVLIVDDERRYADMLAKRLFLRGLTCKVRYDGQSAIDAVAREHFPMIILDLRLPDLYGTEVLVQVKRCRPDAAVIILTGHGTEKDREQCMARGAHSFMNKPVDVDRLVAIMTGIREGDRHGRIAD
jgi:DNA-binding NtrC family response regulator